MSDLFKAALVIALAIVLGTYINSYFSPYQSCIRTITAVATVRNKEEAATYYCTAQIYGK